MQEWITINELSDKTGIADSTIRRYVAKFSDFFVVKGGARSKRYEETAIKILIRIKELYEKGLETEQVYKNLEKDFPLVLDGDAPEEQTTLLPALATSDDISEIKEMLKAQQEFSNRLLDRLSKQEEYIKDSIDRRDRELMQALKDSMSERRLLLENKEAEDKKEDKNLWQRFKSQFNR